MKTFKKSLFILLFFSPMFFLSAQNNFSNISLVTFRSNLSFTIGQDTQTYTAERNVNPFSINKYETSYSLWYTVLKRAEKLG